MVKFKSSRTNNNKINRLHERCLRIIFSDKQSSFETLLEKDGSVSIHNRNLQILATEMYKIKNNLSTSIIADYNILLKHISDYLSVLFRFA